MSLFKDILDNSEESIIIVSKDNNLEYVNNRFLLKFKTNIVKCATDFIIQMRQENKTQSKRFSGLR